MHYTLVVRLVVALVQACCLVCSFQARFASLKPSFQGLSKSLSSQRDSNHFDYLVIGGGSGGIASARRAAIYGVRVAVVEKARLGGTCVNVGCVPKKVMYNAATVAETLHDAEHFGFNIKDVKFDWLSLKHSRDKYVNRLNAIYKGALDSNKIQHISGTASFTGANSVEVDGCTYSADNVLIAVGGRPSLPSEAEVPGVQHCISSDGFFALEQQPRSVAVIGGGYIGVEIAGVLNALGTKTHIFTRRDKLLNDQFDGMVVDVLGKEMQKRGICHFPNQDCKQVVKNQQDGTLTIITQCGDVHGPYEQVLFATGRVADTEALNLPAAGIAEGSGLHSGYVEVDEFQNTATKGVYALGDVCGKVELTPMAIAAGRRLADRLFGGAELARADYDNVPTVVFSHPPIGVCGLSEEAAVQKYGREKVKVYTSTFTNMFYGTFPAAAPGEEDVRPKTAMKLVTLLPEEKVLGIHLIGMGSDEILQGFAVALKMGANKADLDRCMAIHPTAAEELVTMAPWGLSSPSSPSP